MNITLTTKLLETGLISNKSRATVLLGLLILSLTASALEADVANQVSQDIVRYKAFDNQSAALKQNRSGTFVTIGADAACDYDTALSDIQEAIDSSAAEVRVASNGTYQNNLIIENQSIVIRGGFADCVAAEANQQDINDLTLIDGSALAEPVIYITGSDFRQQIWLENLTLTAGTSMFPKFGGGLSVQLAATDLQLNRVGIIGNGGSAGAGMDIDPGLDITTNVIGRDVVFQFNQSSSIGGGLRCQGQSSLILGGMSVFANNAANLGGGMYLFGGCSVSMYSDLFSDPLISIAGLFGNVALSNAGGAHVISGAQLYLFGQRMCVEGACLGSNQVAITVQNNEAGTSSGLAGNGGGIYVDNSGFAYANGLFMASNSTREFGGGIYIGTNSEAVIERESRRCWDQDRCNLIIDNQSGTTVGLGGGVYVADGGDLNVSQTYFEENRADFGTAVSASGENAFVTVEGSVFDDNGDGGSGAFSDFSVIRADLGASVSVRHSTIVDNDLQGSVFDIGVALGSSMNLFNSIVHDPSSGDLFGPASGALNISCLLAHENASFSGDQVVVDDPQFFNRLGGDFHLNPISPAIDMCQGIPIQRPLDMDTEPRGWDDPGLNNGLGVFDAGADESYVNDVIFKNGFESPIAMRVL